jgi:hypothetical protein
MPSTAAGSMKATVIWLSFSSRATTLQGDIRVGRQRPMRQRRIVGTEDLDQSDAAPAVCARTRISISNQAW